MHSEIKNQFKINNKMRKSFLAIAVIALVFTSCKENKKDKVAIQEAVKVVAIQELPNNVNITTSTVTWTGKAPSGAHNGTIALKSGSLVIENGNVKSGEFVIDMNSIANADMKGSKRAGKLEGHLKAADFFDVAKFPTAKFIVTSSEVKEGKVNVTGNLTIKDVTKSITIPATVSDTDGVVTFKSDVFNINRADFNVKYGSKSFFDNLKDKFIDDLMEISFDVKAKK